METQCCLCGAELNPLVDGPYAHNPDPMADEGRCCTECNVTRVIPGRLLRLQIAQRKQELDDLESKFESFRQGYK